LNNLRDHQITTTIGWTYIIYILVEIRHLDISSLSNHRQKTWCSLRVAGLMDKKLLSSKRFYPCKCNHKIIPKQQP
jgi:hypothetical protein